MEEDLGLCLSATLPNTIKMAIEETSRVCYDKPYLSHKEKIGLFVTTLRRQLVYNSAWVDLPDEERKKYSFYLLDTKFWKDIGVTKWHGLL